MKKKLSDEKREMINLYSEKIGTYLATHDLPDELRNSRESHATKLREQFTLEEIMQYVDEQTKPAMKEEKNPLYTLLEKNPFWVLPLVAIIFLVGSWILPFIDLIYGGLWPFKEIVAWTILGLAVFVVVSHECRRTIETLAGVAIKAHERFLRHQQHSIGSPAISQNGSDQPESTYIR